MGVAVWTGAWVGVCVVADGEAAVAVGVGVWVGVGVAVANAGFGKNNSAEKNRGMPPASRFGWLAGKRP